MHEVLASIGAVLIMLKALYIKRISAVMLYVLDPLSFSLLLFPRLSERVPLKLWAFLPLSSLLPRVTCKEKETNIPTT